MKTVVAFIVTTLSITFAGYAMAWGLSQPNDLTNQGYTRGEARQIGSVSEGVVLAVRRVTIETGGNPVGSTANMAGSGLGGLLGGLLGSRIGNGNGRLATTAVGAVLGAAFGNSVTNRITSMKADEIIVRLKDNRIIAVTQAADNESFARGEPVILVSTRDGTRVTAQTFQ